MSDEVPVEWREGYGRAFTQGPGKRRGMRVELTVTGRNADDLVLAVMVRLNALDPRGDREWVIESLDVEAAPDTPADAVPESWVAQACCWDGQAQIPTLD